MPRKSGKAPKPARLSQRLGAVALGFGIVVLIFLGTEVLIASLLNNPSACPDSLLPVLRRYYEHHDCDIFQVNQERTHYDETLFYALNPGRFSFSNREFSNVFEVNSAGYRDDESSLLQPELIVLGDSYSMGWGVDQAETFSTLIEQALGFSVLNMGVSSYGTAREVAALARIDTANLEYLIIQYSPNDLHENQQYFVHDHTLVVSGEHIFEDACITNQRRIAYYPFKHSFSMLRLAAQSVPGVASARPLVEPDPASNIGAADAFLDIVRRSTQIPAHTQIIVFSLEAEKADNSFIEPLADKLELDFGSSLHDRMSFVDLSGRLTAGHRYILDPHLNAAGHQVVAEQLLHHISHLKRTTGQKEWFYPSGATALTCDYVDGLKEGTFTAYWADGEVSRTSQFRHGGKTGLEVDFSRNGLTTAQRNFLNDQLHGWSTTFDRAGLIIGRTYYEHGEVIDGER